MQCYVTSTSQNLEIVAYACEEPSVGTRLGMCRKTKNRWNYQKGICMEGNLLLELHTPRDQSWRLVSTDSVRLQFAGGTNLFLFFPGLTIPPNQSVYWWVASDKSVLAKYTIGFPINEDAWYAMNYDPTGLAQDSFDYLSTSPLVHAGDTTVRAYGSTATNQSLDTGVVDIGYHYLDRGFIEVAGNGRLLEYEDGTPYIPMGFSAKFPMVDYQNDSTLLQVDSYLTWAKAHGFNSMGRGFHDYHPNPYSYPYDVNTWYSIETPRGKFNNTQAVWMDQYLNEMDKYQITYWLGSIMNRGRIPIPVSWVTTDQRSHINFWYSESIYAGMEHIVE